LEKWVKVGTNDVHLVTAHGEGEYSEIEEMKSYHCANMRIFVL